MNKNLSVCGKTKSSSNDVSSELTLIPTIRCTSTGRKCDGYATIDGETGKAPGNKSLSPAPRRQLIANTGSLKERRALDFFYQRSARQFSGFFGEAFWARLVPQLSNSEPAIRHALIAVSSFHEKSEQLGKSPLSMSTELVGSDHVAYYQAMNSLISCLSNGPVSTRIPLTACILFICMEFLRGDMDAAITHIESGINVLKFARDRKNLLGSAPEPLSSFDSECTDIDLAPIFCELGFLASLFGRPSLGLYSDNSNTIESLIPNQYSNISEAKINLFDLLNASVQFIESVGEAKFNFAIGIDEIAEWMRIASLMEQWKTVFEDFAMREQHRWSSVEIGAANILRVNFLAMKIRIAGSLEVEETSWDRHKTDYEEIVELSEKVLLGSPDSHSELTGYFSFELGVVSPLHFVAFRCRWPIIRRRALSLLYLYPRREGLYDSKRSYNVFKRVMLVEELSLGLQPGQEPAPDDLPPEFARIHQIDTTSEPVTPIGTPVNFISKLGGPAGVWYIRREFIHLGSMKIYGNIPDPDSNALQRSLSQSTTTSARYV
jgi:hypothetical protein